MLLRTWRYAIVALALLSASFAMPVAAEQTLTPEQKLEVESIIRDYLLKNPELLVEVMEELERRRKEQAVAENKRRLEENRAEIYQSKYDFVLNPEGRIPVVEFFYYQCAYFKRALPSILQLQANAGQASVRFIYKEYPILGEASVYAARAAIAARRQDKYVPLHNALMGFRGRLSEESVMTIAAGVGLDVDQLKADMQLPEVQQVIEATHAAAQAMNIRGTPTMIIGDTLVPGAIDYQRMVGLVEEARSGCTLC